MVGSEVDEAWGAGFLGRLPARHQEVLRRSSRSVDVEAGGSLFRADGRPRLVLVVEGMVRVVTLSAGGRKATIRYARPGDCVGVLSLVTAWHPVAVEAVTDAQVLFVDVDVLTDLARREPGVGWALAQYVAEVSTDVIEMMSSAVFGSVRQRLARHLLDLAVQRGGVLYVLQGQSEMADAVGSVREVVARTIREFRERGLVSRDGVGLRLDDPAGLDAVAASD